MERGRGVAAVFVAMEGRAMGEQAELCKIEGVIQEIEIS